MSLKDVMAADLDEVFFDLDEFAELHNITVGEEAYSVPAIVQGTATDQFARKLDGVYVAKTTLRVKASDIPALPVRGTLLNLDDVTYLVADSRTVRGRHVIDLEVPDT